MKCKHCGKESFMLFDRGLCRTCASLVPLDKPVVKRKEQPDDKNNI